MTEIKVIFSEDVQIIIFRRENTGKGKNDEKWKFINGSFQQVLLQLFIINLSTYRCIMCSVIVRWVVMSGALNFTEHRHVFGSTRGRHAVRSRRRFGGKWVARTERAPRRPAHRPAGSLLTPHLNPPVHHSIKFVHFCEHT